MVKAGAIAVLGLVALMFSCQTQQHLHNHRQPDLPAVFEWRLPEGFPTPQVPSDNPMTPAKIELGRLLFHDKRLSGDGSTACSSCHHPELAYSDGRRRAVGIGGREHPRSAMSLTNVAYNATLGWDDPGLMRLEAQALIPLFNTQPPEMGASGHEQVILERLRTDPWYLELFAKAFPQDKNPVTFRSVTYALAAFERTLISGNTAYDRWAYHGQPDGLNQDQRAGAKLFFSKRLSCFRCHAGFNFSGPVVYSESAPPVARFHNTGLYNEDGRGAYPDPNTGLHRHSGRRSDMGKFRAPTLRNIALTAPYMHDGSIATLEAVIDHYAKGGRAAHAASRASVDPDHVVPDPLITGFVLTPREKGQLVAFLNALTDDGFIKDALRKSKP